MQEDKDTGSVFFTHEQKWSKVVSPGCQVGNAAEQGIAWCPCCPSMYGVSLAKASVESHWDTWGTAAPLDWEGFKEGCREEQGDGPELPSSARITESSLTCYDVEALVRYKHFTAKRFSAPLRTRRQENFFPFILCSTSAILQSNSATSYSNWSRCNDLSTNKDVTHH